MGPGFFYASGHDAWSVAGTFFSAGNTGACISAAQMHMRRLRNVHRPGIAVPVPTFSGPVVLIDVGANIEPKPHHLAQYGVMGDALARRIIGIENPRVALMNVGGEEQKGTEEMKRARDLLRAADGLDFERWEAASSAGRLAAIRLPSALFSAGSMIAAMRSAISSCKSKKSSSGRS